MDQETAEKKQSWLGRITKNYALNALVAFLLWPFVSLSDPKVGGILFFVGVYYVYKAIKQHRDKKAKHTIVSEEDKREK